MYVVYYWEINIICVIVLMLLLKQLGITSQDYSMDNLILKKIIWVCLIMCVSHGIVGSLNGYADEQWRGIIHVVMHIGRIIYYSTLPIIVFLWVTYVKVRLHLISNLGERYNLVLGIPIFLILLVIVTNPFTEFMFTISEDNIYSRGQGVYLHWIVVWGYVLLSIIDLVRAMVRADNNFKRRIISPLFSFAIAPAVASMIQMILPGTSLTQVGITISIIVIFLDMQQNQITTDVLTGLNNRHGFNKFIYTTMNFYPDNRVSVFLLDLNGFKQINDKYGHVTGDLALQEVSTLLKYIVQSFSGKCYLSRFGGDEFTIVAYNAEQTAIQQLQQSIISCFEERNQTTTELYTLHVSVGQASGICKCPQDIERLLEEADKVMYQQKKCAKF